MKKILILTLATLLLVSCNKDKCTLTVKDNGKAKTIEPAYDYSCHRGTCTWIYPGGGRGEAQGFMHE